MKLIIYCILISGIYSSLCIGKLLWKIFKKTNIYIRYIVRRDAKELSVYIYKQDDNGISIADDPFPNKKYRRLVYDYLINKNIITKYVITTFVNSKKVSTALYINPLLLNGM